MQVYTMQADTCDRDLARRRTNRFLYNVSSGYCVPKL